jgi:hypothetical protein
VLGGRGRPPTLSVTQAESGLVNYINMKDREQFVVEIRAGLCLAVSYDTVIFLGVPSRLGAML